jgi:hypothetical protein
MLQRVTEVMQQFPQQTLGRAVTDIRQGANEAIGADLVQPDALAETQFQELVRRADQGVGMIRPYRPTDPAGSMKFTKVDCQHEPTGSWLMQPEGAEFRQQAVTLAGKAVPYHVIYPIRCGTPHPNASCCAAAMAQNDR